ncbi:MAG: hypothetical protein R2827_09915 [Bdellovibrionales bacterium]
MINDFQGMAVPFVSRFAEVLITLEHLRDSIERTDRAQDQNLFQRFLQGFTPTHMGHNFVLLGDFNLPSDNYLQNVWKALLDYVVPGFRIYVNDKTSISQESGLSEAYDHIIANPARTQQCHLDDDHLSHDLALAPRSFDFTQIVEAQSQADLEQRIRYHQELGRTVNGEDRTLKKLMDWVNEWRGISASEFRRKMDRSSMRSLFGLSFKTFGEIQTIRRGRWQPLYTEENMDDFRRDMFERIIDMSLDYVTPYRSVVHGFSDHIPVYMTCK